MSEFGGDYKDELEKYQCRPLPLTYIDSLLRQIRSLQSAKSAYRLLRRKLKGSRSRKFEKRRKK